MQNGAAVKRSEGARHRKVKEEDSLIFACPSHRVESSWIIIFTAGLVRVFRRVIGGIANLTSHTPASICHGSKVPGSAKCLSLSAAVCRASASPVALNPS
jgi:hypothetical protein